MPPGDNAPRLAGSWSVSRDGLIYERPVKKPALTKALREREKIRRAGWFS